MNASSSTRVLLLSSPLSIVRSISVVGLDPQMLWKTVLDTIGVAVRVLGHVVSFAEGKEFICALGPRDAGLCLELLDRVSLCFFLPQFSSRFAGSNETPP